MLCIPVSYCQCDDGSDSLRAGARTISGGGGGAGKDHIFVKSVPTCICR